MSISRGYRRVFALALVCVGLFAVSDAAAQEFPYTPDAALSLTGDCSTTPQVDEVEDPGCPYPASPEGPSGRFRGPRSVAVDDWGNLYVANRSNDGTTWRIDVFDPEGHFISEVEDPHGPRSIAVDGEGNLYAYEKVEGGEPTLVIFPPSTYEPATGKIEYDSDTREVITTELSFLFNGLAIDRRNPSDAGDDRLFVAGGKRIREFGSAKEGNELKETIEPAGLNSSTWVAVDSQRRRLYTTHCKENLSKCVVWVLEADPPYAFIKEIDGSTTSAGAFFSKQGEISLAVDETNGHLFVGDLVARDDIYEFDESYELVSSFEMPNELLAGPVQSAVADNPKNPDPEDLNPEDNYRYLFIPVFQSAGHVIAFEPPDAGPPEIKGTAAASIGESEAEVEATIEPNDLDTGYRIEYTLAADTAYTEAILAASGTVAGSSAPKRVSAIITGLEAGTAYRFRVVAENEAGEAEPPGEATFSTYDDAPVSTGPCPNQALRTGPSAGLPDCRAYELVTPADTNGRSPFGTGMEGERFGEVKASPGGGAVSFEVLSGTLPGTEGAAFAYGDPYLATRTSAGWSSALAGPTGTEASKPTPGSFSPDQGHSFWTAEGKGSLVVGSRTTYVRYPDGTSELIGRGSLGSEPRARGRLITENAGHIVFETSNADGAVKLEPEAPAAGTNTVYDRTRDPLSGEEETHVVSLLPGDVTPTEDASYLGASAEGEGIAFEIEGTLYLRVGNEVTHEIGPGLTFAGVSEAGRRIFYLEGGDLKAFDTEGEEEIVFADTAAAVVPVNVAPQGTRAYFVSETAIPGSGENPNGESAQEGEQNLYLSEEGQIDFVATVTERDVEGIAPGTFQLDGLGLWTVALANRQPAIDPSRLTPDGDVLVFQSRAELDGYEPGEFPQVYRYDHDADRLHCVSCPPTATPATDGAMLQSLTFQDFDAPLSLFGFVPALREDGLRLFFESTEALVSTDTDGLRDVYEWEEEGVGSCSRPGGCVSLISSGQSRSVDYLFGHSRSGDDVFIRTGDVLVPGDEETTSIYDARVGGGFATPEPFVCRDEGSCRPAPTSPPAPQSSPPPKSGNFVPPKKCPRGKRRVKRKGKWVCVKKHKHQRITKRGAGK